MDGLGIAQALAQTLPISLGVGAFVFYIYRRNLHPPTSPEEPSVIEIGRDASTVGAATATAVGCLISFFAILLAESFPDFYAFVTKLTVFRLYTALAVAFVFYFSIKKILDAFKPYRGSFDAGKQSRPPPAALGENLPDLKDRDPRNQPHDTRSNPGSKREDEW